MHNNMAVVAASSGVVKELCVACGCVVNPVDHHLRCGKGYVRTSEYVNMIGWIGDSIMSADVRLCVLYSGKAVDAARANTLLANERVAAVYNILPPATVSEAFKSASNGVNARVVCVKAAYAMSLAYRRRTLSIMQFAPEVVALAATLPKALSASLKGMLDSDKLWTPMVDGYCYLHLFDDSTWVEVAGQLGACPTVAVLLQKLERGYDRDVTVRVSEQSGVLHVAHDPGAASRLAAGVLHGYSPHATVGFTGRLSVVAGLTPRMQGEVDRLLHKVRVGRGLPVVGPLTRERRPWASFVYQSFNAGGVDSHVILAAALEICSLFKVQMRLDSRGVAYMVECEQYGYGEDWYDVALSHARVLVNDFLTGVVNQGPVVTSFATTVASYFPARMRGYELHGCVMDVLRSSTEAYVYRCVCDNCDGSDYARGARGSDNVCFGATASHSQRMAAMMQAMLRSSLTYDSDGSSDDRFGTDDVPYDHWLSDDDFERHMAEGV